MADRNDPRTPPGRTNDPVTAPDAPGATPSRPRQSDFNTRRNDPAESASRARSRESGRSAAKWIGIGLAVLVLILVLGALFGGGSWIWGPADEEPVVEGEG